MNKRRLVSIGSLIFAAAILFSALAFRHEAQNTPTSQMTSATPPKEEATKVQRGLITEKEREYSKEIRRIYGVPEKKITFTELINRSISMGKASEEIGRVGLEPELPDDPDRPKVTPAKYLRSMSCAADAVVIGSVKDKIAHMTDDELYVFSEYPLTVIEVLRDNPRSPIRVDDMIEIARPGGLIELDGRRIRVEDRTYPYLEIGKSYLLFIRYLPSTRGYSVSKFGGEFLLEGKSFRALLWVGKPSELRYGNNLSVLLGDRSIFTTTGCPENEND